MRWGVLLDLRLALAGALDGSLIAAVALALGALLATTLDRLFRRDGGSSRSEVSSRLDDARTEFQEYLQDALRTERREREQSERHCQRQLDELRRELRIVNSRLAECEERSRRPPP